MRPPRSRREASWHCLDPRATSEYESTASSESASRLISARQAAGDEQGLQRKDMSAPPDRGDAARPFVVVSATPAMALPIPPTERELTATTDDICGMAPITFWTRPDGDTDTHRNCLELERQGRVFRIRETPRGWMAWKLTERSPH